MKSAREGATEDSFEVIARGWLKKFIDPMSESHSTRVYARFVNDIFPSIGSRPITEITPKELLKVILRIEERGAKDTAHRDGSGFVFVPEQSHRSLLNGRAKQTLISASVSVIRSRSNAYLCSPHSSDISMKTSARL